MFERTKTPENRDCVVCRICGFGLLSNGAWTSKFSEWIVKLGWHHDPGQGLTCPVCQKDLEDLFG